MVAAAGGRQEYRRDALLAVAVGGGLTVTTFLYGSTGTYGDDQAAWWVSALMIVANAAPLAFRRRFPMTVAVLVALAFAATQILRVPEVFLVNFTLFLALYTVGAWCSDRVRAEAVRWVIIGGMFAWLFIAISFGWASPTRLPNESDSLLPPAIAFALLNILINVLYFGAAWYAGNRAWASAVAGTSSPSGPPSSPRNGSGPPHRPSRSSACGSPASCTTWSRTTCR